MAPVSKQVIVVYLAIIPTKPRGSYEISEIYFCALNLTFVYKIFIDRNFVIIKHVRYGKRILNKITSMDLCQCCQLSRKPYGIKGTQGSRVASLPYICQTFWDYILAYFRQNIEFNFPYWSSEVWKIYRSWTKKFGKH